jgi:hypothetical protein
MLAVRVATPLQGGLVSAHFCGEFLDGHIVVDRFGGGKECLEFWRRAQHIPQELSRLKWIAIDSWRSCARM